MARLAGGWFDRFRHGNADQNGQHEALDPVRAENHQLQLLNQLRNERDRHTKDKSRQDGRKRRGTGGGNEHRQDLAECFTVPYSIVDFH